MPIEVRSAVAGSASAAARPSSAKKQAAGAPGRREKFRVKDRLFFTERLSLLLATGNALHSSLEAIARQSSGPALRGVVEALQRDVSSGLGFSDALRKQPEAFPETYVSLVAAAERGGFLPEVLDRLLEMEEKRRELSSTVMSSLSYPGFLLVFSVAVVIFILVVVFPKFGELFESIRDQLPATTIFLMTLSDILRAHWIPISISAGAAGFLGWRWLRSPAGVEALDALTQRTPVLRDFANELALVQFLRAMGMSLGNGVPMIEALQACRTVVGSRRFQRFVDALLTGVNEGRGIAVGFREATFLPPLVGQMISTAEDTGQLPAVMTRVADFYEREWRKRIDAFTKLIEPAMLLVMGVVVGVLVGSLLLPIFKLSRAVG